MHPIVEARAARARGTERFKTDELDGACSDYLRAVLVVREVLQQRQDARELLLPCQAAAASGCA